MVGYKQDISSREAMDAKIRELEDDIAKAEIPIKNSRCAPEKEAFELVRDIRIDVFLYMLNERYDLREVIKEMRKRDCFQCFFEE